MWRYVYNDVETSDSSINVPTGERNMARQSPFDHNDVIIDVP